jgi:hypothetical protein
LFKYNLMERKHIIFKQGKPKFIKTTSIIKLTTGELARGRAYGALPRNSIGYIVGKCYWKMV